MKLRIPLYLLSFGLAGVGAWMGANHLGTRIEAQTEATLRSALNQGGYSWVGINMDGQRAILTGEASDALARLEALELAARIVPAERLEDQIKLASRDMLEPPDFRLEILRQNAAISVIGLVPSSMDRAQMAARLGAISGSGATDSPDENSTAGLRDLTTTAAYPPQEGWRAAVDLALRAASVLSSAQITARPGRVEIKAAIDSREAKSRAEAELMRAKPDDIELVMDIAAPLPLASPYLMRFSRGAAGSPFSGAASTDTDETAITATLEACVAETEAEATEITTAATQAGAAAPVCTLALGVPAAGWGAAARAAINTVTELETAQAVLSDLSLEIRVPSHIEAARSDAAMAKLKSALPPAYSASLIRVATEGADADAPRLQIKKSAQSVVASGPVARPEMSRVLGDVMRARLGEWTGQISADNELAATWDDTALGAVAALSLLVEGEAVLQGDLLRLTGISDRADIVEALRDELALRAPPETRFAFDLRYDPNLDPSTRPPAAATCLARMVDALEADPMLFEPGSATPVGLSEGLALSLASAHEGCARYGFEIGGHTDSQGSDAGNLALSEARAEALRDLMRKSGLDVSHIQVRGYGASRPRADNETEEGREANRRLEFTLLSDKPAPLPLVPVSREGRVGVAGGAATTSSADQANTGADDATLVLPLPAPPIPAQNRHDPAASLVPPIAAQADDAATDPDIAARADDAAPPDQRPPQRPEDTAPADTAPTDTDSDTGTAQSDSPNESQ